MPDPRWSDDFAFTRWLVEEGYAKSEHKPFLTDSTLFYMWVAFKAGREYERQTDGEGT